jgi:hypothetical protein
VPETGFTRLPLEFIRQCSSPLAERSSLSVNRLGQPQIEENSGTKGEDFKPTIYIVHWLKLTPHGILYSHFRGT